MYVVHQSVRDPRSELNEQEIGEKVFGRSASYDRSHDNIVRVNATELRRRIDLYFMEEGAQEQWLLEIPRGGYKPMYRRRVLDAHHPPTTPTVDPLPQPVPAPLTTPRPAGGARWSYAGWIVAIALLAVLSTLLVRDNSSGPSATLDKSRPALTAFWSGFSSGRQQDDIVLPDDSISLIEDVTHHPVSLDNYLKRAYMEQLQSQRLSPDRREDLDQISSHNLVTFGTVRAAQMVMAELPAAATPHLTLARFYTTDAMKRNNVILLGGKKANPWVMLFEDHMNFIVDFDYERGHAFIANLHPKPGEQATYAAPVAPNALTGYSVVAYLPNPSHTGDAIILAGVDSDSTSAAAEFLTSERQLEALQRLMKVNKFPYFEVLLKNSRFSGTSFGEDVVAYRAYPKP